MGAVNRRFPPEAALFPEPNALTSETKYPFVDATFAAEMLGVGLDRILQLVADGRLKTYGGRERNPFLRTADITALAEEIGQPLKVAEPSKRQADNPVKRVSLRIRADARWNQVSEADIDAWVREADESSKQAAGKVAAASIAKLKQLMDAVSRVD